MAWQTPNDIPVQWGGADTVTVAGGGTENSDDFTSSSDVVSAEVKVEANHTGTPASGDTVEIYIQSKSDPRSTGADSYDNLGDFYTTLDPNHTNPSKRTVPFPEIGQEQTYRVTAINNDSDDGQEVGVIVTEYRWS